MAHTNDLRPHFRSEIGPHKSTYGHVSKRGQDFPFNPCPQRVTLEPVSLSTYISSELYVLTPPTPSKGGTMRRSAPNRKSSRKNFKRRTGKTDRINLSQPRRGGIRL